MIANRDLPPLASGQRKVPIWSLSAGWTAAVALAALLLCMQLWAHRSLDSLVYLRAGIMRGQWWRLLTGHLVHADWIHLSWNLLGLGIVAALFARELRYIEWLSAALMSIVVIDTGFFFWQPDLLWYVGFSGVLHGLMVAALVVHLWRERDPLTAIVALLLPSKLIWEQFAGPLPFTAGSLELPVVVSAHSWGALGGLFAAVWILRRRALKARYNAAF